jgi:LPS O-antigen subunit length determinant protein (WzzB/FepE family)
MKKNNTYLTDDEIDLIDVIKKFWKEKILILSISIICGLLSYFYELSKPQQFRSEIILKNPPVQIFEPYNLLNNNNFSNNINNNNNNNNIAEQFISNFISNFLSLDYLQSFLEETREFDNFKGYLKSRNISAKKYFIDNKIVEAKDKNIIIPNKYSLTHTKELNADIFLNEYVEFIKKKTTVQFKNILKLTIVNSINNHQEAFEIAKKIQLENPIIKTINQQQVVNEPEALFYKGTIVLSENLISLNKKLIKLENDQFVFDVILQKPITFLDDSTNPRLYFALGVMLGLFLSLVIIYLKNILK